MEGSELAALSRELRTPLFLILLIVANLIVGITFTFLVKYQGEATRKKMDGIVCMLLTPPDKRDPSTPTKCGIRWSGHG